MVQESSKSEKQSLPELPANDDTFWKDADNEVMRVKPPVTCAKGGHVFERIGSLEVKCTKCPAGYYLPAEAQVKNGHVYLKGLFLI